MAQLILKQCPSCKKKMQVGPASERCYSCGKKGLVVVPVIKRSAKLKKRHLRAGITPERRADIVQ